MKETQWACLAAPCSATARTSSKQRRKVADHLLRQVAGSAEGMLHFRGTCGPFTCMFSL